VAPPKPVHVRLKDLIRERSLPADGRLPSERELLQSLGSSRITIRDALIRLESEGLIYRQNRRGWFVSPARFVIDLTRKIDFTAMASAQSRVPSTVVRHIRKVAVTAAVLEQLKLAKGSIAYQVRRVRSLEGRPIMMEDIYLDPRRFEGIEHHDLNGSITRVQRERFGIGFAKELSTLRVVVLDGIHAEYLTVNPGVPCLQILRTRFDEHGIPVDYNVEHWLHNSIEMMIDGR
jgi:DNA-binding GntR family transcriptional regulator